MKNRNANWVKELRCRVIPIGHDIDQFKRYLPLITRDKIEETCRKLVDDGYNSIHPSFAHYRWNFLPYMDRIVQFVEDCVDIGHRYGLKVWEHHSVVMWSKVIKGVKYKQWQLDKLLKVDFRNGQPYYMHNFNGVVFCCSNPYFREAYFDLAKRLVVDIPVDIYMPDDMSAANSYYDCACPYCRNLFKKHTGYGLPKVGDLDKTFFVNMSNPAWRAWLRFRSARVGLFLKELKAFLESEGRKDIVMTTCNSDSLENLTRISSSDQEEYDKVGKLDLGLDEIWGAESLTYNWPRVFIESQTNREIGVYYGIPYISHGYPRYNEEAVFNAAREMTLGMCFNMTQSDNAYLKNGYRNINVFAEQYKNWICYAQPASNIGVVFSRNTRDFYGEDIFTRLYLELHCDELAGWCENLIKMNLPYRILIDSFIETEDLSGFKTIILPNCACMSKKMARKLTGFVERGGCLIATNETSLFDRTGQKLKNFQLSKVFGFNYIDTARGYCYPIVQNYARAGDHIHYDQSSFRIDQYDPVLRDQIFKDVSLRRIPHRGQMVLVELRGKSTQVLAHTPIVHYLYDGYPAVVVNKVGKGRVLYFNGLPGLMNHSIGNFHTSQYGEAPLEVINESIPEYESIIRNAVDWSMGKEKWISLDKKAPGLVVHLTRAEKGNCSFLHILATPIRQLTPDGRHLLKKLIPAFTKTFLHQFDNPYENPKAWKPDLEYVKVPALNIRINNKIKVNRARMAGIDFLGEKSLKVNKKNGEQIVILPAGAMRRYAIIKLEE